MLETTTPFDAAKYLTSPADHAELLSDALETEHGSYIAAAGEIVKAAYQVC